MTEPEDRLARIESLMRTCSDTLMEMLALVQKHALEETEQMKQFQAHMLLTRQELNLVRAELMTLRAETGGS